MLTYKLYVLFYIGWFGIRPIPYEAIKVKNLGSLILMKISVPIEGNEKPVNSKFRVNPLIEGRMAAILKSCNFLLPVVFVIRQQLSALITLLGFSRSCSNLVNKLS